MSCFTLQTVLGMLVWGGGNQGSQSDHYTVVDRTIANVMTLNEGGIHIRESKQENTANCLPDIIIKVTVVWYQRV